MTYVKIKFYIILTLREAPGGPATNEINCVGISKAFSIECNSLSFKNESCKLVIKYF